MGSGQPATYTLVTCPLMCRDNLVPDIQFWRNKRPPPKVRDLFEMAAHRWYIRDYNHIRRLIEIRNNTLRFPLMHPLPYPYYKGIRGQACVGICDPQLSAFVDAFNAGIQEYNMSFPDVLFILNVGDTPACGDRNQVRNGRWLQEQKHGGWLQQQHVCCLKGMFHTNLKHQQLLVVVLACMARYVPDLRHAESCQTPASDKEVLL